MNALRCSYSTFCIVYASWYIFSPLAEICEQRIRLFFTIIFQILTEYLYHRGFPWSELYNDIIIMHSSIQNSKSRLSNNRSITTEEWNQCNKKSCSIKGANSPEAVQTTTHKIILMQLIFQLCQFIYSHDYVHHFLPRTEKQKIAKRASASRSNTTLLFYEISISIVHHFPNGLEG